MQIHSPTVLINLPGKSDADSGWTGWVYAMLEMMPWGSTEEFYVIQPFKIY